jgi:hypothetical protein
VTLDINEAYGGDCPGVGVFHRHHPVGLQRARKGFDEAALLPFSEDDLPAPKGGQTKEGNKNG